MRFWPKYLLSWKIHHFHKKWTFKIYLVIHAFRFISNTFSAGRGCCLSCLSTNIPGTCKFHYYGPQAINGNQESCVIWWACWYFPENALEYWNHVAKARDESIEKIYLTKKEKIKKKSKKYKKSRSSHYTAPLVGANLGCCSASKI